MEECLNYTLIHQSFGIYDILNKFERVPLHYITPKEVQI